MYSILTILNLNSIIYRKHHHLKFNLLYIKIIILHPKRIKSSESDISISFISGWQITQLGFPPNFINFASASPIVLETDNFPGITL